MTDDEGCPTELASRKTDLITSADTIARVGDRVSEIAAAIRPEVTEFLEREPGCSSHFNAGKEDFGYVGANVPLLLKGLARISQAGSFLSAYVWDLSRARSGCDLARGVGRPSRFGGYRWP